MPRWRDHGGRCVERGFGEGSVRVLMPNPVASELARAGLRSSPKTQTVTEDFCERCALKREQAPSPQWEQSDRCCPKAKIQKIAAFAAPTARKQTCPCASLADKWSAWPCPDDHPD